MGSGSRTCFLGRRQVGWRPVVPRCSPGASEPKARHHMCPVLVFTQDLTATAKSPHPHHTGYNTLCTPPVLLIPHSSPAPPTHSPEGLRLWPRTGNPGSGQRQVEGVPGGPESGFLEGEPRPSTHQQPLEGRVELPDFVGQPLRRRGRWSYHCSGMGAPSPTSTPRMAAGPSTWRLPPRCGPGG